MTKNSLGNREWSVEEGLAEEVGLWVGQGLQEAHQARVEAQDIDWGAHLWKIMGRQQRAPEQDAGLTSVRGKTEGEGPVGRASDHSELREALRQASGCLTWTSPMEGSELGKSSKPSYSWGSVTN